MDPLRAFPSGGVCPLSAFRLILAMPSETAVSSFMAIVVLVDHLPLPLELNLTLPERGRPVTEISVTGRRQYIYLSPAPTDEQLLPRRRR
jgi:hypothetical protein